MFLGNSFGFYTNSQFSYNVKGESPHLVSSTAVPQSTTSWTVKQLANQPPGSSSMWIQFLLWFCCLAHELKKFTQQQMLLQLLRFVNTIKGEAAIFSTPPAESGSYSRRLMFALQWVSEWVAACGRNIPDKPSWWWHGAFPGAQTFSEMKGATQNSHMLLSFRFLAQPSVSRRDKNILNKINGRWSPPFLMNHNLFALWYTANYTYIPNFGLYRPVFPVSNWPSVIVLYMNKCCIKF